MTPADDHRSAIMREAHTCVPHGALDCPTCIAALDPMPDDRPVSPDPMTNRIGGDGPAARASADIRNRDRPVSPEERLREALKTAMVDRGHGLEWRGPSVPRTVLDALSTPAGPSPLREQIRVMADWLDITASIVAEHRGDVLAVAESVKAADHGRSLAHVKPGPTAEAARAALSAARPSSPTPDRPPSVYKPDATTKEGR